MHRKITRLTFGAKCRGFTAPAYRPLLAGEPCAVAQTRGCNSPASAIEPNPSDVRPRNDRRPNTELSLIDSFTLWVPLPLSQAYGFDSNHEDHKEHKEVSDLLLRVLCVLRG
jgi:hypothetical protein